jgi:hypothetical protein
MNHWIRLASAAVGVIVALYGLGKYEAWWTIAFAIGGLAILLFDARHPAWKAIAVGGITAGVIALGMLGLFLIAMSPFADARPDLPRGNGIRVLVAGAGMLVAAVAGAGLTLRFARRPPGPRAVGAPQDRSTS